MGFLLRNWHLKLSAFLLATVLYTGLVFSGSFDERGIQVRVEQVNQPPNSYVLTGQDLGLVQVQFRAPQDLLNAVVAEAFVARIDLSEYDMERAPEPQALEVEVRALNDEIEIISVEPETVRVEIDRTDQRTVPVEVDVGVVPDGLEIDTPQSSEQEVQVRGPASIVARVDRAIALVSIDGSGIDVVDRPVDVVAVDLEGQPVGVGLIEVSPQAVSVSIEVQAVEETRTVPVRPQISGIPAPGFALEALSVEPSTVTLRGLPEVLAEIPEIVTDISIDGLAADESFEAELILPEGVSLADDAEPTVNVTATIGPSVSSRTFVVGVLCENATPNACLPGLDQLSVTLSGPGEVLAELSASALTPVLDAGGLGPGSYSLSPVLSGLPEGVELLNVAPGAVPVTIVAPATPTPAPTEAP